MSILKKNLHQHRKRKFQRNNLQCLQKRMQVIVFVVEPKWNLIQINPSAQSAILSGQNIQIQHMKRIIVMSVGKNQSSLSKNPSATPVIKNCINKKPIPYIFYLFVKGFTYRARESAPESHQRPFSLTLVLIPHHLFTIRAVPSNRNKCGILPDIDPLHLDLRAGMLAEPMLLFCHD